MVEARDRRGRLAAWLVPLLLAVAIPSLALICFGERNRPASLEAEAVVIVPLDQ